MDVALGVVGILGLLIALYGLSGEEGGRVTRRAWTRLAILAATGLSFFPGCGGERPPPKKPDDYEPPPSLLRKWGRLGRIWREMSGHRDGTCLPYTECRLRFVELGQEMTRALEALPAWPELSVVLKS